MKFGQTHEQFVTQYVNHYGRADSMNVYRNDNQMICKSVSLGSFLGEGLDTPKPSMAYSEKRTVDKVSVVFITHERTNVVKYTL